MVDGAGILKYVLGGGENDNCHLPSKENNNIQEWNSMESSSNEIWDEIWSLGHWGGKSINQWNQKIWLLVISNQSFERVFESVEDCWRLFENVL